MIIRVLFCSFLLVYSVFDSLANKTKVWKNVNIEKKIEFKIPDVIVFKDTLDTKFYNSQVDSSLSFQVHYIKNAILDSVQNNPILRQALIDTQNDTLKAIQKVILLTTNASLLSTEKVKTNNIKGVQFGLYFNEVNNSDFRTVGFMRVYYYENNFLTFTATSSANDIIRLLSQSEDFFKSIKLRKN